MISVQSKKIVSSNFCFFLGSKTAEASSFSVNCGQFAWMLVLVFLLDGFNSQHVINFTGLNFFISTPHSLIQSCIVSSLLLSLVRLLVLMFFILLNALSASAELILWHKRKSTRWNKLLNPKLLTFSPISYHDLGGNKFLLRFTHRHNFDFKFCHSYGIAPTLIPILTNWTLIRMLSDRSLTISSIASLLLYFSFSKSKNCCSWQLSVFRNSVDKSNISGKSNHRSLSFFSVKAKIEIRTSCFTISDSFIV